MQLQARSYSTKIIRPKPVTHQEEDGSLVVVATSWGQPEHAMRVVDEVVKYVGAAKSDVEVTSPFEFLTSLSDEANYLKIAIQIANEQLYRGDNRAEFFSGVEVVALFQRGSQLAWAHVGQPNILIQRRDQHVQPISVSVDLSSEFSQGDPFLSPLPSEMIGFDPGCYIRCGSTVVSPGDRVVLLASSIIPPALMVARESMNFQLITQKIIQESPDSPFWLGVVDV